MPSNGSCAPATSANPFLRYRSSSSAPSSTSLRFLSVHRSTCATSLSKRACSLACCASHACITCASSKLRAASAASSARFCSEDCFSSWATRACSSARAASLALSAAADWRAADCARGISCAWLASFFSASALSASARACAAWASCTCCCRPCIWSCARRAARSAVLSWARAHSGCNAQATTPAAISVRSTGRGANVRMVRTGRRGRAAARRRTAVRR